MKLIYCRIGSPSLLSKLSHSSNQKCNLSYLTLIIEVYEILFMRQQSFLVQHIAFLSIALTSNVRYTGIQKKYFIRRSDYWIYPGIFLKNSMLRGGCRRTGGLGYWGMSRLLRESYYSRDNQSKEDAHVSNGYQGYMPLDSNACIKK